MLNRVVLVLLAATAFACHSATTHVRGEAMACESDSDCDVTQVCVRNVAPGSALGECIDEQNYDPWKNRQLPNIINLKNKEHQEEIEDGEPLEGQPEAQNPDHRWWEDKK